MDDAKGVEAIVGGEEGLSVDSVQALVTGYMLIAPVGLVPVLRKSLSVALATFAATAADASDDCN
jgi:hypothetical protein